MKSINHAKFAVVVLFAVSACKKNGNNVQKQQTAIPPVDSVIDTHADVYIAGTTTADYPNNYTLATFWKNGVATILPDSLSSFDNEANAIALKDKDVYIAGSTHIGTYRVANFWKNGIIKTLAGIKAESMASAIAISGNDVYIAGYTIGANGNQAATYWKNGVMTVVPDTIITASVATAIAVDGTDVYLAGLIFDSVKGYTQAAYWKNGVATILAADPSNPSANAIAVNATGIYVAGYDNHVATLWKNGIATALAAAGSEATSVALNGTDVYVGGSVNSVATYWKNGNATMLTYGSPGFIADLADAMALNGNNVFVAGGFDSTEHIIYWFNGKPIKLTKGIGVVRGIAVVPR